MSFWNKEIFHIEPAIFGLEVSDTSIKVLELGSDGQKSFIRSFNNLDIPSGIVEEGRIIRKEKLALLIRQAVNTARPKKIKTRKVVCSLPESKVFLRIVSIPKMKEVEAKEAVKWEMEANIPLAIDQVYYDWQFLEISGDGKQEVLTVAVAKEVVDDFISVLEMADLEPYGFEAETTANIRSIIPSTEGQNPQSSLIIDLGSKKTSFIIQRSGVPYFTSSIPFSSLGIDDVIAKTLNLNGNEAKRAKVDQGIMNAERNPIAASLEPMLQNLSSEIEKTLDFSSALSYDSGLIENIILCGGGANLKGLPEYLSKKLNKNVSVGDPRINLNLRGKKHSLNQEQAVRYATVIGLAIRAMRYGYYS